MSEARAEKECPFCCERIDARARRCPRCRTQQSRWAIMLHPGFVAAFYLLIIALGAGIMAATLVPLLRGQRPLVAAPPGLRITESKLTLEQGSRGRLVVITGNISNDGKTDWEDVAIEGTVVDKDGGLAAVFDYSATILPAGQQRGFRMDGPAYLPEDRYVRQTVKVIAARRSD